jgi:4-amino-4-deoxy-L-arabinose transferase-like glycosyltransferase
METSNKATLKSLLPLVGLVLLYLIIRLVALTVLPMSSDEAIWIHWAQIIVQYPSELLISRLGDQSPLFAWLNAITLNIFSDPLVAGRWVSVLAGLASMVGLYFIGRDAFNRTAGFLAGLIYIVVPFAFFFDRLALPDGLLSALSIWAFRWTLHIAQETRPSARAFKVLGVLMGVALLTQTRALFLFPIPVIVFYFWQVQKRPGFWKQFGTSVGIAFALNLPVFLSGSLAVPGGFIRLFFSESEWTNFIHVASEPGLFWGIVLLVRLSKWWEIHLIYWTLPLALVLTASLVYLFREKQKIEKVLWLWFLIPSLIFLLIRNLPISHLYLIAVPPLILLAAAACDRLAHFILLTLRKLFGLPHRAGTGVRAAALGGFMVLVLFNGITWDLAFIRNPVNATYYFPDQLRFAIGPSSGYGIREAAQFLTKEAEAFRKKTGIPLPVLLPMDPGHPAEGITVYLWNHPDVRFVPAFWWPKSPKLIPTGLRFSHRPSIYQTSPVMRRETTLLDYAHFILPGAAYSPEKFLEENPRFQKAWGFEKLLSGGSIAIFKNHPPK